jgi:hypothetical protein
MKFLIDFAQRALEIMQPVFSSASQVKHQICQGLRKSVFFIFSISSLLGGM